jgi:predicted nucleotide-binding protein
MASLDVFNQINNAVLDLQGADYQTYERPLKALGRLLQHPDLQKVNDELTRDVDLDAFLREGEASGGSMVGTQRLPWPEDTREILGLSLLLIQKFAVDPELMLEFAHQFYYSGGKHSASINSVTGQLIIPFARDYKTYVEAKSSDAQVKPVLKMPLTKKVFVVHGHDVAAREMVTRFLLQIGFEPIILFEQANQGRTVIEKVETHGDVSFAVVLLTPDDVGRAQTATDLEPRPRPNVLLELGYFLGRLGRDKVCSLMKGDVRVPSDFAGVVWVALDDAGAWQRSLAKELQAAGHMIDWNKVMR